MSDLGFRLAAIKKSIKDNPRFNPSISIDKVIELEQKYGIKLPIEYRAFVNTVANGGGRMLTLEYSFANPVILCGDCQVDNDFFKIPFVHTSAYNPNDDPSILEIYKKRDRGEILQSECERIENYDAAGTMIIHSDGCGYCHRLVITGAKREIWADGIVGDYSYLPLNIKFLDWFEDK